MSLNNKRGKALSLILFVLLLQGCATLLTTEEVEKLKQQLIAADAAKDKSTAAVAVEPAPGKTTEAAPVAPDEEPMVRYSELNNMAPVADRNYKRMTRKKMEEESELYSSAGSLWKMEGQTSYLFAENRHRQEGDPTTIKVEGAALKAIESKVAVIADLLKQLEKQKIQAEEDAKIAEEEKIRLAQLEEEKKLRAERIANGEIVVDPMDEIESKEQAETTEKKLVASRKLASLAAGQKVKEEKIDLKEVENIPSKIVEKMSDDTYRIKGQQFLTIKKKSYKVIATALVRVEDFNDSSVSSNKLLDAQYDIIHMKRTTE